MQRVGTQAVGQGRQPGGGGGARSGPGEQAVLLVAAFRGLINASGASNPQTRGNTIPYSRDYKYPSIIRTPQIQVPI